MSAKSTLTKERMTVGGHIIDIRMNTIDDARQSVVFVHGIGVSSRYFIPFAEQLAGEYHVIAIDLPGYGKTPKPPRVLSIREMADVVLQLTSQLGLKRPVIVGHSMGCQIAARAVQKQPRLFSKVLLIGPTVNNRERTLFMQTVRLFQDTAHEPLAATLLILRDYLRMGFWRYIRTCRYMLRDHIEESLADCTIPALIVRGENDKIVPTEWVRVLCKSAPNATYQEIPDGSHAVQYMLPAHLATIFRRFVPRKSK
jgi:pimeloyl-ACP methyl ester carboxylesterase